MTLKGRRDCLKSFIKVCFCSLMALGLVGCSEYSMPKYKPGDQKQVIATSKTDTRMFLSQKVQDVISAVAGVSSQLLIYQEDSITPTASMKEALKNSVDDSIKALDKNVEYLKSFKPASVYEDKRNNIVKLMGTFRKNLEDINNAVEEDNFKKLKSLYSEYTTILTQIQTISQ